MARQTHKKQTSATRAKATGSIWERLSDMVSDARKNDKSLDLLLEDLQAFNRQLVESQQQENRMQYFEQLMQELQALFLNLNREDLIKFQLWLGHTYETHGAYDPALSAFQKVLAACDRQKFARYAAEAHLWIGHILLMQSKNRDAQKAYQKSLNLAQKTGDVKAEIDALNGFAYYAFEHGNTSDALKHWKKALELAESINDSYLLGKINNNLGAAANVRGEWEKALAHYAECLPRFEKLGDVRGLAETHHNIAMTYADAGRWPEANAHYQQSFQLAKEVGDMRLQAMVKLNRVELTLSIGDTRLAEALCRQALKSFVNLEDRLGEADSNKFLGVIKTRTRDWVQAKIHFEKSIKLARKYKSPLCEAETHWEYGRMLKAKGSLKTARKQYETALDLFKQLSAKNEIDKITTEIAELAS